MSLVALGGVLGPATILAENGLEGKRAGVSGGLGVPIPAIVDAETRRAAAEQAERARILVGRNIQYDYLLHERVTCYACSWRCGCVSSKMGGNWAGCKGVR